MEPAQSRSSIPPSRAKWQWGLFALLGAVTLLVGASADYIRRLPTPSAPRSIEQPPADKQALPEIPKELDSSAADRFVREQASRELAELKDAVSAMREVQCTQLREMRATRARLAQLEGGKRGAEARAELERDTRGWALCPVLKGDGTRQELNSLDEAADSALRR